METLILNRSDIKALVTLDEIVTAVKDAFVQKSEGKVQMPAKNFLFFKNYQGDLRSMPSYLEGSDIAAVKIVNSHPENRAKGIPSVMGVTVLVSPETGAPLCIMDATLLTALRTGAASCIATDLLARKEAHIFGMVGAGAQAQAQLEAIVKVRDIKYMKVFDRVISRAKEFTSHMSQIFGSIHIEVATTVADAVKGSDIVTTITPTKAPIVMDAWVEEGVHINAVGADAPGKQELDPKILKRAKVVVDDLEQASHGGEINVPISSGIMNAGDVYAEIGDLITGKKSARTSDKEITMFDSTGLAIQDAASAAAVYKKALQRKVGLLLDFLD
ncbi:MAG: alanine dehydrogenase [Thaumarchaeota archaeon]|nr:alanine dehydrogenase [Nitrososphaerota archaeon]